MDRYDLLIQAYRTRDAGTLMFACYAAASAAAWPLLEKFIPEKFRSFLIRIYSSGVLAVYVMVLIVNLVYGGG